MIAKTLKQTDLDTLDVTATGRERIAMLESRIQSATAGEALGMLDTYESLHCLGHCYTSRTFKDLQGWCPCKCPFGCFAGSNNCYGYTRCDTSSQNGHAKFHASVDFEVIFGFLLS